MAPRKKATPLEEHIEEVKAREAPGANGPTQDEFLAWVRELVKAEEALENAKSARRRVRKQAKAAGIELGYADATTKMTEWAPSEVREHFRVMQQYAEWMKLPVGTQLDLFGGIPEAALPDLDFKAAGFAAATTGRGAPGEPPNSVPADQVQNWMAGWHEGQAFNAPSPLKDDPPPALTPAAPQAPDEPTEDEIIR